jgi:hypothetical protein
MCVTAPDQEIHSVGESCLRARCALVERSEVLFVVL